MTMFGLFGIAELLVGIYFLFTTNTETEWLDMEKIKESYRITYLRLEGLVFLLESAGMFLMEICGLGRKIRYRVFSYSALFVLEIFLIWLPLIISCIMRRSFKK